MLTPIAAFWLFIVWLIALGGAIGSFLNVVVYRLPLGISLVYPPSRCPKCEKLIPWYDNIPVLGWIVLRGRCRQCHNPISARYPIVEAFTAAMFGAVAVVELPSLIAIGVYGFYPYHLLLLCTLLCAALIEYDGNRVPWRLFVPALVVGFIAPLFWPELRLVSSWIELRLGENQPGWLVGAIDGLVGMSAGVLLAAIVWGIFGSEKLRGLGLGLVCVGLFLGWQAATMVAMCTGLLIAPMWLPEPVSLRLRIPGIIFGIVTLALILMVAGFYAWLRLVSHGWNL